MSTNGATGLGVRTLTTAGLVVVDPHVNHPAPDHPPLAAGTTGTTAEAGWGSRPDDHGSAGDMMMLCAAMLLAAAAGVLLAVRLVRIAHGVPLGLRPLFRVPTLPATARAGTGPPAVWEFSVVRC